MQKEISPIGCTFLLQTTAHRKGRMKCPKCGGLMVVQSFFDHFINFEGWKCLNCGKIIEKRENTIKDDAFSIFYQKQKIKKQSE